MTHRRSIALVALLLALASCQPSTVELYHAASEREAVRILDVLNSSGVSSARKVTPKDLRKGAWRVLVAQQDLALATRLINTTPGVLGRPDTNLVEVVSGSGFAKTPAQVQSVLDLAQSEQLARQLEVLPHVLQASVTLDRASSVRGIGAASTAQPSASAVVLVEPGWDPAGEAELRKTLRFGVSGLQDEHLSVTVSLAPPRESVHEAAESSDVAAIDPSERWITLGLGLTTLALALRWWASTRRAGESSTNGPAPDTDAPAPTVGGLARRTA